MPETTNLQVNPLDFSKVSMDRLDEINETVFWHAVHEILDTRQDGDAIAAFNAFIQPPGDKAT